jgi:predicted DNA-binding protein (MmcQ/YjbR family)
MAKKKHPHDDDLRSLRKTGLAFPGAHTKSPWPGHLDLAVNDKTFAYLSLEGEPLQVSCKLPQSAAMALTMPFCSPTGYGLGKSGWVTATFDARAKPPLELLRAWIDESYRAIAPKKQLKQLGAATPVAKPAVLKKRKRS